MLSIINTEVITMKELFIEITNLKPVHHNYSKLILTRSQKIKLQFIAPDTG